MNETASRTSQRTWPALFHIATSLRARAVLHLFEHLVDAETRRLIPFLLWNLFSNIRGSSGNPSDPTELAYQIRLIDRGKGLSNQSGVGQQILIQVATMEFIPDQKADG